MARLPWYVWTSLASVTCILVGGYWDISWHMTIGRDTFWTPAHLAIQLGGIIAGAGGTVAILAATLGKRGARRDVSVRVWGFRGPLGAFLAVWGAATMLASAPFDNWWHTAYGLDVKILSPPHVVLTLGILGVASGAVLQIAAALNRAPGSAWLDRLIVLVGGEICVLGMTSIYEQTYRCNLHNAVAYRAAAIVAPLVVLAFGGVARHRWAATLVAAFYTSFMIAMLWLFPLFPAEAKLGPVYQPITHYIPLQFPVLILAPVVVIDWLRPRLAARPRWLRALVFGPLFVGVLVAAQWPFADFMLSPSAHNWVFGAHYQPYFMHPDWYGATDTFFPPDDRARGLGEAVLAAIASSYLGLVLGDAMRKVQR